MQNLPLSIEERNDLIHSYSDFYKDAYGFRPRHICVQDLSDEQLLNDFDTFERVCKENAKEEAIQLEADEKAWDELIQKTISLGAGDKETALRWIVEAEEDWDAEAIVWRHGLLFSERSKKLVEEINQTCSDILQKAYVM